MEDFQTMLKSKPDAEWASVLGVSVRAVASWRYGERKPSAQMAFALERAGVPRHVSRPDLWPPGEAA